MATFWIRDLQSALLGASAACLTRGPNSAVHQTDRIESDAEGTRRTIASPLFNASKRRGLLVGIDPVVGISVGALDRQ